MPKSSSVSRSGSISMLINRVQWLFMVLNPKPTPRRTRTHVTTRERNETTNLTSLVSHERLRLRRGDCLICNGANFFDSFSVLECYGYCVLLIVEWVMQEKDCVGRHER